LPPLTTNAEQGAPDKFCQTRPGALEPVGTPGDVAELMGDAMTAS
jgi:hypothetical protein